MKKKKLEVGIEKEETGFTKRISNRRTMGIQGVGVVGEEGKDQEGRNFCVNSGFTIEIPGKNDISTAARDQIPGKFISAAAVNSGTLSNFTFLQCLHSVFPPKFNLLIIIFSDLSLAGSSLVPPLQFPVLICPATTSDTSSTGTKGKTKIAGDLLPPRQMATLMIEVVVVLVVVVLFPLLLLLGVPHGRHLRMRSKIEDRH